MGARPREAGRTWQALAPHRFASGQTCTCRLLLPTGVLILVLASVLPSAAAAAATAEPLAGDPDGGAATYSEGIPVSGHSQHTTKGHDALVGWWMPPAYPMK